MSAVVVHYIGPESKVFHLDARCPALLGPDRYYPLNSVAGAAANRIMAKRRPCKRCVR